MSHRISKKRAKELREKELQLQKMQKDGIILPKSNRRTKKYLLQIKRQKGFISYLKARYTKTGRDDLIEKLDID